MTEGLPLFELPEEEELEVPDPPTGPAAEPYDREDGRTPAFFRFLASEEGQEFWVKIQAEALGALRAGERRFSCLGYIHTYREVEKFRVNNTFAPWFADMLIGHHPDLADIVERRKRKKPGPFVGA